MAADPTGGDFGDSSIRPPESQYESSVLAWAMEALQEGESFIKSQPGIERCDETIKAIMSHQDSGVVPGPLSKGDVNQLGKIALDLRSGLTDTKIFWEYRTNNRRYEQPGVVATKLGKAWWLNQQCDMRLADGIAWTFAAGSSAMRLVYSKEKGEQELQAWDPRDVVPVRLNDWLDYNSGFAVLLRKENTVNYLRALYPQKAGRIVADRDGAFAKVSSGGLFDKMASVASPLLRGILRDTARSRSQLGVPSCDTYQIEVKDDSVNRTGQTVLMGPHDSSGKPTANWSYAVPPGMPLYPRGRVIVLTKTCVLYDGPNIYWHGRFTPLKLTLDQWPFSFFGKSPLWDLLPLQSMLRDMVRYVDNHFKRANRPGLVADKNNVSKALWDKLDPSLPGLKVMQNPSMGKGIQRLDEPPMDAATMPVIQFLIDRMEFISGSKDVTNFAKLGQMPASETIEKMMEAMSPAIRARSRTMEAFMRPLALMTLSNFMQFYPMEKRIRALGPDGAVLEDFQFDKGSLLPDFIHAEDHDAHGNVTAAARQRGPRPQMERALEFLPQFEFYIAPGSLLAASEVTRKLLYLQLSRAGYLDIWTLLDTLGVPNVGAPPNGANTITERLQAQNGMQIAMAANSAGRKASGQQMPQMRSDGKIAES